jgi:hypothetical protein
LIVNRNEVRSSCDLNVAQHVTERGQAGATRREACVVLLVATAGPDRYELEEQTAPRNPHCVRERKADIPADPAQGGICGIGHGRTIRAAEVTFDRTLDEYRDHAYDDARDDHDGDRLEQGEAAG